MNSRNKQKVGKDYKALKIKITINTVVMLAITMVIIQLLYQFVFHGRFANFVVMFLENTMFRGQTYAYDSALETYR
ncbi:MAG: vancomycin resistance histidine kinase VanS, partial [Acetatifactor sp.]|nr:vancomycin resistance histidine kinase VanS [Acetatifactor sp.]